MPQYAFGIWDSYLDKMFIRFVTANTEAQAIASVIGNWSDDGTQKKCCITKSKEQYPQDWDSDGNWLHVTDVTGCYCHQKCSCHYRQRYWNWDVEEVPSLSN